MLSSILHKTTLMTESDSTDARKDAIGTEIIWVDAKLSIILAVVSKGTLFCFP